MAGVPEQSLEVALGCKHDALYACDVWGCGDLIPRDCEGASWCRCYRTYLNRSYAGVKRVYGRHGVRSDSR